MPIEAVKIPQNVYVEDRIIGPVTLRQLGITGIGAGISYALYSTAGKMGPVSIPVTVLLWIPAMIAAAFAFLKINDLSLFNIILLMIEHANKPSVRYWSSHAGISINFVTSGAKQAAAQADTHIDGNTDKLAELTHQLEKREQELAALAGQNTDGEKREVAPQAVTMRDVDGIGIPATEKEENAVVTSHQAVNPQRVQAQGLDPTRSIDGLSDQLGAFSHLFPQA